ncbi:MAG TPA: ABC transporter permease [Polyangiaceae bacterium]
MIPLSYNVRSLLVRKTTTFATVFGVALVVFVLSSSQMLAHGVERTMGRSGSPDNAIVLRKGADAELSSGLESRLVALVKAAPGVKHGGDGAPLGSGELVMVISAELINEPGQMANVLVRGVPDEARKVRPEIKIVEGRPSQPGTNEIIIGKRIRGKFRNIELGGTFEINKNRPATVVGIFESGGSSFESEAWGDLDTIRAAFGRPAEVSSITVKLEAPSSFDAFEASMEHDKQLGLQVSRESDYYEKQSEGTSKFVKFLGTTIVFFFSVGAMIGAMITMYAAVANRKREIGTLRALGFSQFQVLTSFLFEAFFLAFLGGAFGVTCSLVMTFVEFSMMNFASWSEVVFSFEPTPRILASALIGGGLMGIVGGFLPAIRAARTSPLVAMRD